jgi:hypothetical protein
MCDTHKPISNYKGTDKRYHSYRYCSDCVDAELIRCNTCNLALHKDKFRKVKGQYLDRKTQCNSCRCETAKDSEYAKAREWRAKNRDKMNSYSKTQYERNPGYWTAKSAKRRAMKLKATGPWTNTEEINHIYKKAKILGDLTGIKHHVDHIIPLQNGLVCGLHIHHNLQVITATENLAKSNNWSIEEYNSL